MTINFSPNKVFDLWISNFDGLEYAQEILAEDNDIRVIMDFEEDGPVIGVAEGGELIDAQQCFNAYDCESIVRDFYDTYLPGWSYRTEYEAPISKEECDSVICAREEELSQAVVNIIDEFTSFEATMSGLKDYQIEELKDIISDYIGNNMNLPVYRPTYIVDSGDMLFDSYPYSDCELTQVIA